MYHNTLLSYCSILTVCSSSLFSLYLCTSSGLFDPFVFILFSFLVPNSFSLIFRLSFPRVSANKYVIEVVFFWSQYCKTFIASVCGYISRKNIDSTLATFDGVSLQRGTRYYKTFQTNSIETFDLACQCANSLIAPNTQQTFSILYRCRLWEKKFCSLSPLTEGVLSFNDTYCLICTYQIIRVSLAKADTTCCCSIFKGFIASLPNRNGRCKNG